MTKASRVESGEKGIASTLFESYPVGECIHSQFLYTFPFVSVFTRERPSKPLPSKYADTLLLSAKRKTLSGFFLRAVWYAVGTTLINDNS